MTSGTIARPVSILYALAIMTAACGGDAPGSAAPAGNAGTDARSEADAARAPAAPEADRSGNRGQGTLRLGDTTYEFAVRACDFSGETDDLYQTVSGRGTTPDGESFDLFVSRNDAGGMLTHTVSLQIGDIRAGNGRVIEAQHMRHGDSWMSTTGGATEPLVRIDGDRLTASGSFRDQDAGTTQTGSLEATCR